MPNGETNIGLRSLRIFMSYAHQQASLAANLKILLEGRGFEVFIAHNDIEVSVPWREEIIRNLKRCDIFIPIISIEFKNSDWTDQETGMAINENKHIIPLYTDTPPYGFIREIQGLRIANMDADAITNQIFRSIIDHSKFGIEMKDFTINTLISSITFEQANTRVVSLSNFNQFSSEQIHRLVGGTIANNQIYGGYTARPILRRIFTEHQDMISEQDFQTVMGLLGSH